MKDIFLHRLKIKDAFLRNAGVVRNTISTERYSLTGINSRFGNNNFKRDIVKMIVFRRNTSFNRKNGQFSSRNPVRNIFFGRYNVQFPIVHSVRNASLGRKNGQSLTLHSVGMHPQNQQQCYLK